MNKYTLLTELRWPTLATLGLCLLLPGCPFTDNYFIDGSPAGSGPVATTSGGAYELSAAGVFATAGSADAGKGSACACTSGGSDTSSGGANMYVGNTDAGSSDAGSADAGTSAGSGNAGGASAGSGGAGTAGAGANGGAGTGGAAAAGASSILPDPACGEGVIKGSACSANGAQYCYKSCGPDNMGYKRETCVSGAYDELQSGCTFPTAQDYSCYKVPPSLPMECPVGIPRGGKPCQIADCKVCFGGTIGAPQYQDSTGAQKPGYCVCSAVGSWTCGSIGSWPCPDGQGCN